MSSFPKVLSKKKLRVLAWIEESTAQTAHSIISESIAQKDEAGVAMELWEYSTDILSVLKHILSFEKDVSKLKAMLQNVVEGRSVPGEVQLEDFLEVFDKVHAEKANLNEKKDQKHQLAEQEQAGPASKRQRLSTEAPEDQQQRAITTPTHEGKAPPPLVDWSKALFCKMPPGWDYEPDEPDENDLSLVWERLVYGFGRPRS
ncbi:uncharacterized protein J3D65DRAFT_633323 [Phyllosticta citribraziliensis]|uniref:Uncharacterized protein n=1 Tax=Phyllosticta citribraziliensis TaxID=989973 RepID=A0ABR1LDN6_9PEZI